MGLSLGSFLGRQIALGACRDDGDDDLERRPLPPGSGPLPPAVDLRAWMTPVEDQGQLGSCTSNAIAGALEYLVRRGTGEHVDLSRLFVYFNQRLWDGNVRDDAGGSIASAVRVVSRLGIPSERAWPYQPDLFAVQPTAAVYSSASQLRASDWWYVPVDRDALCTCLARGFPVVFGTRVTESFFRTPASGMVAMPGEGDRDDRKHGRHALLLVGYDDARRLFIVRNSWGPRFGDGGYCYMPYAYVLNRAWTSSCWAISLTTTLSVDASAHSGPDLRSIPRAAPSSSGVAGGVAAGAGIAGAGAQLAVGMLTGSGLLAGLAGGLIAGVAPGVSRALSGRDAGAIVDADKSDEVLARMRGGAPSRAAQRMPWDDGLDEEAAGLAPRTMGGARALGQAPRGVESKPGPVGSAGKRGSPVSASKAGVGAQSANPVTGMLGVLGAMSGISAPGSTGSQGAQSANPPPASIGIHGAQSASPSPSSIGTVAGGARPAVGPDAEAAVLRLEEALPPAIATLWRRDGGRKGPLGRPVAEPFAMHEGAWSGSAVRFEDGAMFAWEPPSGVAAAPPITLPNSEPLYVRWVELGAGRSALGWPVAPVALGEDGATRALPCARGSLCAHPTHGVHAVAGNLFVAWRAHGGLAALGAPLEDAREPSTLGAPEQQRFERGELSWSAATGAQLTRA